MTMRRQNKKKRRLAVSDLSDDNTLDGNITPYGFTARSRTHQGGFSLDTESVQSPPVTNHWSTSHRSTRHQSASHPSTSHRSASHQSTVSQSPVNQSLVNQALVKQALVNQGLDKISSVNQYWTNFHQSASQRATRHQSPVI